MDHNLKRVRLPRSGGDLTAWALVALVLFFVVREAYSRVRSHELRSIAAWVQAEAAGRPALVVVMQPGDCAASMAVVERFLADVEAEADIWVAAIILTSGWSRRSVEEVLSARDFRLPTKYAATSVLDSVLLRGGFTATPVFVVVDQRARVRYLAGLDPSGPSSVVQHLTLALNRIRGEST